MAGIGFQLHKLLEDDSFFNKAKAYIFASIITSGPWIMSILSLALLGVLSSLIMSGEQFQKISITIVYTFAFTIILTGPIQFVLTRYLADKEYVEEKERMVPALCSALFLCCLVSLLVVVPWYYFTAGSILYKLIASLLFLVIGSIWTMMDFLSCLKRYMSIVLSFFAGTVLSIVLLLAGGNYLGFEGALAGYAAGQLGILVFLIVSILREYKLTGFFNAEFFSYFRRFPFLFFTGLFYNLGLWTDKLIGWYYWGVSIFGNFRAFNTYDIPVFIAYLSIIPSLAYFMIQSETKFYQVHRRFFDSIAKETLDNILKYKSELYRLLKQSLLRLFVLQMVTSGCGALAAPWLGVIFGLSLQSIEVLRMLFFAAGLQVMFLYLIIFMMYFDLSRVSFYMVLCFFVLNFVLNYTAAHHFHLPLGVPYLVSIAISFILGLGFLLASVTAIEYKIFMRQEN